MHLVVDKKSVCHTAFKQLYGISNNKYYAALEKASEPDVIPVHGNLNNQHALKQTAREHMNHWITSYVDEAGKQNPTNDSIYISKYVAKSTLYSMYQFDWIARKLNASELPSPSLFYNIFERQFAHVKFLKQTVLGRCDFCMSIPTQKSKITSEVDKNIFLEACAQHRQLYTQERTSYLNRTFLSKAHPEQMLHLAFDCPDGYDVLHIIPVTKKTANLPKISINAVGTINHSAAT